MLTNEKKDQIQAQALRAANGEKQAGIVASMGVGKTMIGLKHMKSLYTEDSSFLIVVPKLHIVDSWKRDAINFEFDYLLEHIKFITYRSLAKEQFFGYTAIYLDECHSLKFSHGDYLSIYQNHHEGIILGLTGTYPTYKPGEKYKMCNRFCPKVFEYLTDEAVTDDILNDYRIIVHKLPLNSEKNIVKKKKSGGTWKTSEVMEYSYWSTKIDSAQDGKSRAMLSIQRMKALQRFATKENYVTKLLKTIGEKTIVFANTQAQADRLCKHSVHSKNRRSQQNLDLFKSGEIMKLSAVEQLSEGITVPGLKVAIIMHSFGSNRRAPQKLGRLLRLDPDEVATAHILCFQGTVDEKWVKGALKGFDESKITWVTPREYFK